jgi:hypothetical protein
MTKNASKDRRSRPRNDWERVVVARVARHVAEIECFKPALSELGWERAAFKRLRQELKR